MNVAIHDAGPLDAGSVGAILSQAVEATPFLRRIHSRAEEISFAAQMIDAGWVRVAKGGRAVLGFSAVAGDTLHCLYVADVAQGQGIGTALLSDARAGRARLHLWAYAADARARAFYAARGFVATGARDGGDNDAGLPEVRYDWQEGS
ncbi:MAG: GNAT family N-acetyltransferase [Rhodobacteraceae bacterium]|nr:GNAT family N-acetyltransferase [Paracoccaceae bacterium]